MRIVAGRFRGRALRAPPGRVTRPTADRVRQALFDMLMHAPWAGRDVMEGAQVLDGFAGTGGLGLEALSRGAAAALFIESDRNALSALRDNIAACGAQPMAQVRTWNMTRLPPREAATPAGLVFLDPPYGRDLPAAALATLERGGWIAPGALLIVETAADEIPPVAPERLLAQREHGAARLSVWRHEDATGR
ncbi:16S rRNA (guanine(966)-N(2))-methyltransferase RsmD [Novacetimonas hansenii]|uniref:Methyltransferase n=2 Tax=Novacetimonas hansenii TaxID=436 RepID=A0ABQ0SAM1_NOVHA|nr:16S rRNA (guanine(966)-N(2))-methyltransferase RsmD [Novacetimonas hansenii]EFG85835.1 methyltransferase [Novacetimonas hansenii ATCC 23769]GAN82391.1 N6-adenine-specific methylase [Novacetimonas hansenii JCM 7643]GBQ53419.1 N-6 adenine-specific DNA methylase [Novacetimonas hansenii NRIC 0243]GEC62196.1 methyltransferase [Novacetimonas hansenii]